MAVELEDLDRQLAALLAQRRAQAAAADELLPADFPQRRADVIAQVRRACPDLPDKLVESVWRDVLADELSQRQPVTVAFLGPGGSFTHQAAMSYFGELVQATPTDTIASVFGAVESDQTQYGVVPIENSTEGAVTHTFDMFSATNTRICGEILLPIHHNLLARCEISEVKVVMSHPQALAQCRHWVQQHIPHAETVAVSSTTRAAEKAAASEGTAAIAGILAAELYDLPVRAATIEDLADNTTRFLVIGKHAPKPTGNDKTSLVLVLGDEVGGLHAALTPFRDHGINLTMIQSRPGHGTWEYCFFLDYAGHAESEQSRAALEELAQRTQSCQLLGSYPRAIL